MQIMNLGLGEVVFFFLIAVIVLGPERILMFAQKTGRWIRLVSSNPVWKDVIVTSAMIRNLPEKIMHETGLEEDLNSLTSDVTYITGDIDKDWDESNTQTGV